MGGFNLMRFLKKSLVISFVFGAMFLSVGCEEATETTKKVTEEVAEAVQAEVTKDNEFVVLVKSGNLNSYPDIEIETAFADFFSSPKWKYFEAETGEDVVEFTGYCTYMEKKVKAKMQFLVVENSDTFEIGALEFNEVPQNELTKMALLEAIYENDQSSENATSDNTNNTEEIDVPFQIGSELSEIIDYYGDPTYDDYYMGGRLVVFDEEDGYFLDESEIVTGYMIANPDISIFGTKVGMKPDEVSKILSEPVDSYYDDTETQSYFNDYSIGDYDISYLSDEENGTTTSAIIFEKE